MQLYMYVSWYLALGAVISGVGILCTRYTGQYCGRLVAKRDILQGSFDSEKVNRELKELREDFDTNKLWWCMWYAEMVIFWPKALVLVTKQVYKNMKNIHKLRKELSEMES